MRNEVPAIRIVPMSDKIDRFRDRTIEQVQKEIFLGWLPAHKGRYPYRKTGLNAAPGTLVLFQFKGRIIASAVFQRDEKLEEAVDGHAGQMHFEPKSFQTFEPLDVEAMRKVWPSFRGFGHVKQHLNPTLYSQFKRRLKQVASPKR